MIFAKNTLTNHAMLYGVAVYLVILSTGFQSNNAEATNARDIFSKKTNATTKLAARFTLQLKTGDIFQETSLNHTFHSGDEFRFIIRPNRAVFLYVLNINPKGEIHYVWPPADEINNTDNQIFPGQENLVRPDGVFYFGNNTGDDWLILVLSPKKTAPQLDIIKRDFAIYKQNPGKVYEYAYMDINEEKILNFNPRGFQAQTDAPQDNDLGTYAAQNKNGERLLVYPYLLKHMK